MKVDRRAWARAVRESVVIWGYAGIDNPARPYGRKAPTPSTIVLADERFVSNLRDREVEYIAESGDFDDEWAEYVNDKNHYGRACPHGTEEEQARYAARVAKDLADESAKWQWASAKVEWDDVTTIVEDYFESDETIGYFLKEHPVDSAYKRYDEKWIVLEEIHGYCPQCSEVLDQTDKVRATAEPHTYRVDCEYADCSMTGGPYCMYDEQGGLRDAYACPSCSWVDIIDERRPGEAPYQERNDTTRPFDWPPGAPFPPRCSFSGYPMEAPPYEEP